jgi:antitoxin HigA-1
VRIPKDRVPTPPGVMLREEFLEPLGLTQVELAQRIRVPYVRVNELVNGKRRVTPSTALRLAKAFGTSPEFWLNGQLALDLYRVINDDKETKEVEKIEPVLN